VKINSLNAIGRVGRDAEMRYMPDGTAVAGFSFALTSGYGQKQVTTWLNCSIFGKRSETLAPMLLKGTQIGITGEVLLREYTDKDGAKRSILECRVNDVTLPGKPDGADKPQGKPAAKERGDTENGSGFEDFESDLPF